MAKISPWLMGLGTNPSGAGACWREEMNFLKSSETPVTITTGVFFHWSSAMSG
jgi:hypothetical protein